MNSSAFRKAACAAALALCLPAQSHAQAVPAPQAFGAAYAAAGAVDTGQARIVYYRPGTPPAPQAGQDQAANVYLDGEYQASLLPGGYTAFCVRPGRHGISAYLREAPAYQGKAANAFAAELAGGSTYFLKVSEDGSGKPQGMARAEAERELSGLREQTHAISRASAAVPCAAPQPVAVRAPQPPAVPPVRDYTLQSDMLFAFGKSGERDLQPGGRQALAELTGQLRGQMEGISRITVIGHADPIGPAAAAQKLGAARAAMVRKVLIEQGLPAARIGSRSVGNTEPAEAGCGHRAVPADIACNAPNRRVVVRVEGRSSR